ncbi:DUF3795 domain-containing protein [Chloroflexota bacterium]
MENNIPRIELISPCGMDCGVCSGYLAYFHSIPKQRGKTVHCKGCRPRNKQCAFIKKDCSLLKENGIEYCFECKDYPCARLSRLDEQYRTKYGMSLVENLNFIRDNSMKQFIIYQENRYRCPRCGGTICIHNKKCYSCDTITSWK